MAEQSKTTAGAIARLRERAERDSPHFDRIVRVDDLRLALAEIERLRAVLGRLARLGNEPHFGNSTGNTIAREALGL